MSSYSFNLSRSTADVQSEKHYCARYHHNPRCKLRNLLRRVNKILKRARLVAPLDVGLLLTDSVI